MMAGLGTLYSFDLNLANTLPGTVQRLVARNKIQNIKYKCYELAYNFILTLTSAFNFNGGLP